MADCPGCLSRWRSRLPELARTGPITDPIGHPECPMHQGRLPIRRMPAAERWSRLASGFVKVAFTIPPRLAGAPWVAVVLADLPHDLPAVPVISGMGVHLDRDAALGIAAAEAVERYSVLLHHVRGSVPAAVGTAERPVGVAVAGTRRTALRRAAAEWLERLAIQRLAAGSVPQAACWPVEPATGGIGQAASAAGLTVEAYLGSVLAGCWLSVIALVDSDGSPVAVGSAAAGAARVAAGRAAREAYGLWVGSADSLRSPVTEADRRLLTQLRTGVATGRPAGQPASAPLADELLANGHHVPVLAGLPAWSAADIGTRLSDECGLYAVRVAVAADLAAG